MKVSLKLKRMSEELKLDPVKLHQYYKFGPIIG